MTVYVVGHAPRTGPVKIGYAKDAEVRLRSLRRGETCPLAVHQRFSSSRPPADLSVLYSIEDGDQGLERWLHLRLREFRIEGEWFSLGATPGEVVATVKDEMKAWAASWRVSGDPGRRLVPAGGVVAVEQFEVVEAVADDEDWDGTLPGISMWLSRAEAPLVPRPRRRVVPVTPEPTRLTEDADRHRAMFCAWIDAGFTEDQALRLLAAAVGK